MDLHFDRDGNPINSMQWAMLHADRDYCQIAETEVEGFRVSTVWLGINHNFWGFGPPIIFETMIFQLTPVQSESDMLKGFRYCPSLDFQDRYVSEEGAKHGHVEAIAWLKDLLRWPRGIETGKGQYGEGDAEAAEQAPVGEAACVTLPAPRDAGSVDGGDESPRAKDMRTVVLV